MGGLNDSSRQRVFRVFSQLELRTDNWVPVLLRLAQDSEAACIWESLDLTIQRVDFAGLRDDSGRSSRRKERALRPPPGLLRWIVGNDIQRSPKILSSDPLVRAKREGLLRNDAHTRAEALADLEAGGGRARWCTLEGPTYPDVVIETPDAMIVVEGKFTEAGPTTYTTWMSSRHQMLRHMDAALHEQPSKRPIGFFAVEGQRSAPLIPEEKWTNTVRGTRASDAIQDSLPHRTLEEKRMIRDGFIGIVTWQAIVRAFDLGADTLPPLA